MALSTIPNTFSKRLTSEILPGSPSPFAAWEFEPPRRTPRKALPMDEGNEVNEEKLRIVMNVLGQAAPLVLSYLEGFATTDLTVEQFRKLLKTIDLQGAYNALQQQEENGQDNPNKKSDE